MGPRNELEDVLASAPLDDTNYLVYADWLQARGDPRGELIALDDAARRAPPEDRATWRRRRAELVAHHPELVPPTSYRIRLDWHLGFVRGVRIGDTRLDELAPLFAHPSLAFVTAIGLHSWQAMTVDEIAAVLAHVPATLRSLAIGDPDRRHPLAGPPVELAAVLAARPQLEHLYVAKAVRLDTAPALRTLELVDGSHETLELLARAALPALEALVLDLGVGRSLFGRPSADAGAAPQLADLARLLAAPWPRLASLSLQAAPFGDDTIAALIASPLLPRLRTLRLWNAGLTVAGARRVTREHFGHLDLLDLSDAGLDDEAARLVADACDDVRAIPRSVRAS